MNEYEKQLFIINYIKENKTVDILDQKFIDEYIKECNPKKINYQPFGANKVPELSKLLNKMYHCNILNRYTISIKFHETGFPNWVYSYELK